MRCRRNVRTLIQEYTAAAPADRPATELIRFRNAVVALKAAPSQLAPPHTQGNRYHDYVYVGGATKDRPIDLRRPSVGSAPRRQGAPRARRSRPAA